MMMDNAKIISLLPNGFSGKIDYDDTLIISKSGKEARVRIDDSERELSPDDFKARIIVPMVATLERELER